MPMFAVLVAKQKTLNFAPARNFFISNTGFTLLAQAVKHVSGQFFSSVFYSSRLFLEPLGMSHSHFRDNHAEIVKDMAYGYAYRTAILTWSHLRISTR